VAAGRFVHTLDRVWSDRRASVPLASGGTAAVAVAMALARPRGPVTGGQVVAAMLGCAGIGALAGLVLRSRWAILVAPVLFAAVFELTGSAPSARRWSGHGWTARLG
jgi:proline iminopeptidase